MDDQPDQTTPKARRKKATYMRRYRQSRHFIGANFRGDQLDALDRIQGLAGVPRSRILVAACDHLASLPDATILDLVAPLT